MITVFVIFNLFVIFNSEYVVTRLFLVPKKLISDRRKKPDFGVQAFAFSFYFLENERNVMHERIRGTTSSSAKIMSRSENRETRPFLATHASGALLFTCNLETLDRKKNR